MMPGTGERASERPAPAHQIKSTEQVSEGRNTYTHVFPTPALVDTPVTPAAGRAPAVQLPPAGPPSAAAVTPTAAAGTPPNKDPGWGREQGEGAKSAGGGQVGQGKQYLPTAAEGFPHDRMEGEGGRGGRGGRGRQTDEREGERGSGWGSHYLPSHLPHPIHTCPHTCSRRPVTSASRSMPTPPLPFTPRPTPVAPFTLAPAAATSTSCDFRSRFS